MSNINIWAGTTALMYKVHLDELFNAGSVNIKGNYINKINEIGFRWKESSSSSWTEKIINQKNGFYQLYSEILPGHSKSIDNGIYVCEQYVDDQNKYLYPIYVLISGLTSNTSYDVESYYVCEGNKVYYNNETTTTIDGSSVIRFSSISYDQDLQREINDNEQYGILLNNLLNQILNNINYYYGMFFNGNRSYSVLVVNTRDYGGAAMVASTNKLYVSRYTLDGITISGGINSNYFKNVIALFIHEMAHSTMIINNNEWTKYLTPGTSTYYSISNTYKGKVDNFMKFATNADNSEWLWMGKHNFPVISGTYDYRIIGNSLVVAACELSKQAIPNNN